MPVARTFEDFRAADTVACLATRSEAKEAIRELRLATKQVKDGSEEVEFEVKTAQGRSTLWKRYLVQLRTAPVMYKCWAVRGGGAVEADTVLAVVDFSKKQCHPDAWTTALTRPKSATTHLAQKVRAGTSGHVPTQILRERVCLSGRKDPERQPRERCFAEVESSVSSFVKGEPRVYKDVPLSDDFDPSRRIFGRRSCWAFHPCGRLARKARSPNEGERLRERRWSGLLGGGSQQVYREMMGGYQSASLLKQCGGAGVPCWLVLHGRCIFPSWENQERHCPVSGVAPPPQVAARLWVRAHLARGGHGSAHKRRSWCGQSLGKPQKRARKLQDLGQV